MNMTDSDRLAALEHRVAELEQKLAAREPSWQRASRPQSVPVGPPRQHKAPTTPAAIRDPEDSDIARLLGVGGVVALLLAASYLVRLAIDSGWLTPRRQIVMVVLLGVSMVIVGLLLLRQDRRYASLLPAGGMAVLYIAVYGAHIGYGLIGAPAAAALVGLLSVLALGLGRLVLTDVFALLSAVTAYSVPLLLPSLQHDPLGLAIYFSAWALLYSAYAVLIAKRAVYLIALYLGLVLFAALTNTSDAWGATMLFQTLQLLIFGATAVFYSVRSGNGMSLGEAAAHAPALLIFYVLQYATLHAHAPHFATPVAIASAFVLVALLLIARRFPSAVGAAGEQLVASYVSLVAFHAVYLESLPSFAQHGLALVAEPLAVWVLSTKQKPRPGLWPLIAVAGLMYLLSAITMLQTYWSADKNTLNTVISVLFALELYVGYYLTRSRVASTTSNLILYPAHIMAANSFVLLFDDRLFISLAIALMAFVTMGLGVRQQDKDLGRSALLLLGVLTAKVLLADLSDAPPVTRILCLLVLGMTLYGAGLLYQRKLSAVSETQ